MDLTGSQEAPFWGHSATANCVTQGRGWAPLGKEEWMSTHVPSPAARGHLPGCSRPQWYAPALAWHCSSGTPVCPGCGQGGGRRRTAHSIASYRAAALTADPWHSQWGWSDWRGRVGREGGNQNWFYCNLIRQSRAQKLELHCDGSQRAWLLTFKVVGCPISMPQKTLRVFSHLH